ncbi:hypothetical protein [Hymenobacter metallilatus]|uniref:Lipoprotein n=1 Tax=Hymenobacter metallilatus TaxID=2493666 RepID=A0A3R9M3D7_9BACT|nr:hypothetical protein [Hymenobacter metallilatus]RSK35433.1 hypothetical protein EI290_06975 [Hymenobacter metallilatus]
MRYFMVFAIGAAGLLSACAKQECDAVGAAELVGPRWYNTFQATREGFSTYTPTNQTSPGWQYEVLQFKSDHTFIESALGPVDAPVDYPGTWQALGSGTYRIQFNDPQRSGYLLRVKSVDAGKLLAKREQ